jgi:hypothetical protein
VKIKSHRSTMSKAAGKGEWVPAFTAACAALALNPWDVTTLIAMADACHELGIEECQLYFLRCGLDVDAKDPTVNRRAAMTLQRMGQFDQAIACWHRVEQAQADFAGSDRRDNRAQRQAESEEDPPGDEHGLAFRETASAAAGLHRRFHRACPRNSPAWGRLCTSGLCRSRHKPVFPA